MALISTPMPDVGGAKSLEEKFQILLDNYSQLRKELSYSISNLGMDNFTSTLATTIKDDITNLDILNQTVYNNSIAFNEAIQDVYTDMAVVEDNQIVTYYQEAEPLTPNIGDLWFNTTTKKLYRYGTATWELLEDSGIATAIGAAQNAQTTADGKIVSFYQNEMPTNGTKGDLWIDTNDNNKLYRHNGTTFIDVRDKIISSVVDGYGNLLAAKISGIINTAIATVQNSTGTIKFTDNGILIHNLPSEIDSTEAMMLTSAGFLIASEKDIDGNWIWETAISGKSVSADAVTTGTLTSININGVNITGSTVYVLHDDGSSTKIDGSGITRIFSVPTFEAITTDTDIIETFESGVLSNTRVDTATCWYASSSDYGNYGAVLTESNIQDYITCTIAEKYSGSYGLKITRQGLIHSETGVMCYFINYRPTKDTTLTLKYKTVLSSVSSYARMDAQNMDSGGTASVTLNSSTWTTASIALTGNVTYRLGIYLRNCSESDDYDTIFVDDIMFEENANGYVIVSTTQSEQPYYDFTYIKKNTFAASVSQMQITLPDYFRGLDFDVYLMSPAKWDYHYWAEDEPPSLTLMSVNNTVPSFTASCSRNPSTAAVEFVYIVVLNN